jgi:hypothetical protein
MFNKKYLVDNRIISMKERDSAKTKILDLKEFDFSCSSPPLEVDLEMDNEFLFYRMHNRCK